MTPKFITIEVAYKAVEDKLSESMRLGSDGFTVSKAEANALLTEIDELRKFKERMERRLDDIANNVKRAQEMFKAE